MLRKQQKRSLSKLQESVDGQESLAYCSPWDFSGRNSGVGCHFLEAIFLTQGLNLRLLHWQVGSLPLTHQRSPQHHY